MNLKLGTNCGFAINRYIEPKEWTRIVGEELGLRYVQFVADLLNPFWPKDYVEDQIQQIIKYKEKYNISIESAFTSAFTRVNHLMNPDERAREIWLQWFKDYFTIAKRLGAKSGGSHFGILTFATYNDKAERERIISEGVKNWQKLSHFAKEIGFEYLIFEPMSVNREMANTVEETVELMDRVNEDCGVPLRVCLDLGHAPHPSQRDPYFWIEKVGKYSPIIHIQQTVLNKSNHAPFTPENNKDGIVHPEKVLECLDKAGAKEALILFEISHREHWDTDTKVIEDLKTSVDYWRPYVRD
jgi:D-erythrulose 1-phosphate 3-epimerase